MDIAAVLLSLEGLAVRVTVFTDQGDIAHVDIPLAAVLTLLEGVLTHGK